MVAALRNMALGANITLVSSDYSKQELRQILQRHPKSPWELSNEIDRLFSKLMAEDAESAIRFRNQRVQDASAAPEETTLMKLTSLRTRLSAGSPSAGAARRRWAALIKRVWQVDPLRCPRCGSTMKIVSFIEMSQSYCLRCDDS